ncbi:MAG: aminopeptidase [Saprospiraceae bacterium]|nr:aminopeptidase [Saprospiraceae bacterium]MBP7679925.1 aminopeptidase [Saprospiraceae bacterium]
MKKILSVFAVIITFALSVTAQVDLINKIKDNASEKAKEGFQFTPVVRNYTTDVKNQGRSGTCWSYCSSSFIESEMKRMGKEPVDVSEMFTVRNVYMDKGDKYVRLHGHLNFGQGGALPDVIDMIKKYGMVPQDVYKGLNYGTAINNHGEMEAILKAMLDAVIENKNKELTPTWKKAYDAVLSSYLGDYPKEFDYKGKKYTPRTFADDYMGIKGQDYVQFTSFTHQPMYEKVFIMVPDNWNYGLSFNVGMDDMVTIVDYALKNGYTVSWAADVSEKYFSWKNGVAFVPEKEVADMNEDEKKNLFAAPQSERTVTVEDRQAGYDNWTTDDDHGMHIVGIAKDQNGKEYYIVKNSWGTENDQDGYLYVTKNYFKLKTISFLLHKDGVPANFRKQLLSLYN